MFLATLLHTEETCLSLATGTDSRFSVYNAKTQAVMQKAICSLASFFSLVAGERVSNRQTMGVLLTGVAISMFATSNFVVIIFALVLMSVGYCFIIKK